MSATLTSSVEDPIRTRPSRLRGLDGLRGLAVIAVVVFHLWPGALPGGFIGVSVFFTLSGFLITRGLLAEIDRSSTFGLRSFWSRRLRRLWPASAATLAVIVIVWLACGWMSHPISLDVFASFLQVANWRFLASGKAYGLTELSPVAHFWSLAIEEQLYLVVPLLLWCTRRRAGAVAAVFIALIAVSLADTFLHAGDAPVVYYSTVTRAAELAAGGLLAVVIHHLRPEAARRRLGGRTGGPARWSFGVAGAAAILALAWLTRTTSLGTEIYYRGGLSALALLSVIAILGAVESPPLARLLSLRTLTWLGAISYGIYLIHWPIHVALTHTGLPDWLQPWLTLALTLVIAPLSLRFYEDPIRHGTIELRRFAPVAIALSAIILVGSTIGLFVQSDSAIDFDAAVASLNQRQLEGAESGSGSSQAPVGTPEHPARVAMFGDSTAVMLSMGLGFEEPAIRTMFGNADMGCTIGRGGSIRGDSVTGDDPSSPATRWEKHCDWTNRWPGSVTLDGGLDVAIILTGNWDVAGRKVPALGDRWVTMGDPAYDAWLRSEAEAAVDALHRAGATHVLWLTLPPKEGTGPNPRIDRFNEMVSSIAATRQWMRQPDYAGYLRSLGPGEDPRSDGIHVTMATTGFVSRDWLNAVILDTVAVR